MISRLAKRGRFAAVAVLGAWLVFAPVRAHADEDVLLQGFYWDVPEDLWKHLTEQAEDFGRAGFRHVWLPPVMKGASGRNSMGYDTYDHYDLGEYDSKGAVPTRFGTLRELEELVDKLGRHNVRVIADVNVTHVTGGEEEVFPWGGKGWTKFEFPHGRTRWSHADFDHSPREWKFGEHFDYWAPNARHALKEWGSWLTDKLGLAGYRVDQAKGLDAKFLREFLGHGSMWGKWAVAEYWDTDLDKLDTYVRESGSKVFDFPLFYTLQEMANDQSGGFDMRRLSGAGYAGRNPWGAVTFVENHDTDRSQPVSFDKMMAYSYILTMEGMPTVFYKDYEVYGLKEKINPLIAIRKRFAGGTTTTLHADEHLFIGQRNGNGGEHGLVLVMNNDTKDWKGAWVTVKPEWAGKVLKDWTGHAISKTVAADGRVELYAPPRGYAVYSLEDPSFDPFAANKPRDDDRTAKDDDKDKDRGRDRARGRPVAPSAPPSDGLPPPKDAHDPKLAAIIKALEASRGAPKTDADRAKLEADARTILARRAAPSSPGMTSTLDRTVNDRIKDKLKDKVDGSVDRGR